MVVLVEDFSSCGEGNTSLCSLKEAAVRFRETELGMPCGDAVMEGRPLSDEENVPTPPPTTRVAAVSACKALRDSAADCSLCAAPIEACPMASEPGP